MAAFEVLHIDAGSGRSGRRFCVHHPAAGARPRGLVLLVPPFAEEMNKSRRMVALTARALAEAGFAVLRPDLLGCGDSSGEFEDAGWSDWVDDVVEAAAWLRARHPEATPPLWLWGVRAGSLLACEAAARLPGPVSLLLWQPTVQGKGVLQAFVRLRLASAAGGGGKAESDRIRADWAAGQAVDIAGYRLSPALAHGLERATLAAPANVQRTLWLEISNRPEAPMLPASLPVQAAWRTQGIALEAEVVPGPPFWQTVEIEEAPAAIEATRRLLLAAVA